MTEPMTDEARAIVDLQKEVDALRAIVRQSTIRLVECVTQILRGQPEPIQTLEADDHLILLGNLPKDFDPRLDDENRVTFVDRHSFTPLIVRAGTPRRTPQPGPSNEFLLSEEEMDDLIGRTTPKPGEPS